MFLYDVPTKNISPKDLVKSENISHLSVQEVIWKGLKMFHSVQPNSKPTPEQMISSKFRFQNIIQQNLST